MYQGCNKTAQTSQTQITDALFALMEEKQYQDISITEICKKANVSRQTFYSLFSSKDNVIIFRLMQYKCYQPADCHMTMRQHISREYSRYILAQKDLLELLYHHDLLPFLYDKQLEAFQSCTVTFTNVECSVIEQEFLKDYLAATLVSVTKTFLSVSEELSAEDLEKILYKLLSSSYLE